MSTRAQVRFATREEGVSFNEHPNAIHAQFYVHSDGYPEGLGVEIAESFLHCKINRWEIEDLTIKHGDLDYIYYVWQTPGKSTWISIFEVGFPPYCPTCDQEVKGDKSDKCIFVGEPSDLINRFGESSKEVDRDYMDYA
tara:strand:+ start:290 stop:706 length:417 start_codon:yes stop_codon:yes gene_type:complete